MKAVRIGLLKILELGKERANTRLSRYMVIAVFPLCFAIGAGVSLLSGCSGAAGPDGPQGQTGPDGAPGVSNIKMQVYVVTPSKWKSDSSGTFPNTTYYFRDTIFDPLITDQVNDLVTCFYCLGSTMYKWQPLPAVGVLAPQDRFSFSWLKDRITFLYYSTANPHVGPDSSIYFNVAVVPPAIIKRHPNINWKDGNAVLNLPEMQATLKRNEL